MYIDIVPNRNSPPAVLLRESIRQGKRILKRTVANLSHWPAARIEAFRRLLKGQLDHLAAEAPICGPVFGILFVLKQIADTLGLTAACGRQRLGKLALFLVLARVAHKGSRLSAVRWAKTQAVEEILATGAFNEDDLYASLDDLAQRQAQIESALYQRYVQRRGEVPTLFLYDVTSSYLEGQHNELAAFGYDRDGKKGKMQIVIGLLTDTTGHPIAVRVYMGETADPTTVADRIEELKQQFKVQQVVLVGDRGMIKLSGKQRLGEEGWCYITALTDPQIRRLLKQDRLQMSFFEERICEVEAEGLRYILRRNGQVQAKEVHRLEDKLGKLRSKMEQRNAQVRESPRCQPEAGLRALQGWAQRHKISGVVQLSLRQGEIELAIDEAARQQALLLAGCYVIETNVAKKDLDAETVHARYKDLAQVERDIRTLKTGLLEVRPIFLRNGERTRGHVLVCMLALILVREMERRLKAVFGTTDEDPHTVTLPDALNQLGRLCLQHYQVDGKIVLTQLPQPDEEQSKILEALQVSWPKWKCRQEVAT
jgi:transposase